MIPILYEETESGFKTLGLGELGETISCEVTQELNGLYELVMTCPAYGNMFSEIKLGRIILAKANDEQQTQPFKIYKISKPINKIITIYAEHISYILSNVVVMPCTTIGVMNTFKALQGDAVGYNPFTFKSNMSSSAFFELTTPTYFKTAMQGSEGSMLDTFGGEFYYDRFLIELNTPSVANKGVVLEYGKNITDLEQEENIANVVTGIVPYWQDSETLEVVDLGGTYVGDSSKKLELVDFSQDFESKPTKGEVSTRAEWYWKNKAVRTPEVSIKVSFIPLWQTENIKDTALYEIYKYLEQVSLAENIKVSFKELGISATAKVVKYVYDTLRERYIELEIGKTKANLASSLALMNEQLKYRRLIR